jgi:hypothetical protein
MLSYAELYEMTKELKLNILLYGYFIESGTYMGETSIEMSKYFKVKTVELAKLHFDECQERFKGNTNIESFFGDSVKELKNMLEDVPPITKCIFFLDGHYSSGNTAKGNEDVPLLNELKEIKRLRPYSGDLIIIDDYRLFGTNITENWTLVTNENIAKIYQKDFSIFNDRFVFVT